MRAKRLTATVGSVASLTLMGSVLAMGTGGISRCPEDLDGDRQVGVSDMLDLFAQWGTDPGGAPDFNHDGVVDTVDFLTLLQNWGPCPQ